VPALRVQEAHRAAILLVHSAVRIASQPQQPRRCSAHEVPPHGTQPQRFRFGECTPGADATGESECDMCRSLGERHPQRRGVRCRFVRERPAQRCKPGDAIPASARRSERTAMCEFPERLSGWGEPEGAACRSAHMQAGHRHRRRSGLASAGPRYLAQYAYHAAWDSMHAGRPPDILVRRHRAHVAVHDLFRLAVVFRDVDVQPIRQPIRLLEASQPKVPARACWACDHWGNHAKHLRGRAHSE
jgi:hypothetical protein